MLAPGDRNWQVIINYSIGWPAVVGLLVKQLINETAHFKNFKFTIVSNQTFTFIHSKMVF
jgi:hypothetical protein